MRHIANKFLILLLFLSSCSDDDEMICSSASSDLAEFNSCISYNDELEFGTLRAVIDSVILEALMRVNELMPIRDIEFTIRHSGAEVIPEIGIGGFNPNANEVILYFDLEFDDIESSLLNELLPMIAHELHHAKRRRSVGYGNTLLGAMVSEGLADRFSMELTGNAPPIWSTALEESQIIDLLEKAGQVWNDTPYDHIAWFFGNGSDIPRWTGYTLGYELVSDYLDQNPGTKASQLHDEPASSFGM